MPDSFNPVKTFFKSFAVALVSAAIGFFSGVFLGILALATYSVFAHRTPDFTIAYRFVGATLGGLAFLAGFAFMFHRDLRNLRA